MTELPHFDTFKAWADGWTDMGTAIDTPIGDVLALCQASIPGNWQRSVDKRITEGALRYTRTHKHGSPPPGSEHQLEMEVLRPGEDIGQTTFFGESLLDGVNAVPLAKDSGGGRVANVEADMLLLSRRGARHGVYLVEVKTGANTAWFAALENLRQLMLFQASPIAQRIFADRGTVVEPLPPVTAVVLAPMTYYQRRGQKSLALERARDLFDAVRTQLCIDARFAVWRPPAIVWLGSAAIEADPRRSA